MPQPHKRFSSEADDHARCDGGLVPNGGSVNQIEPSDLQTMSLDEFSGLPSWRSATVVMVPFGKDRGMSQADRQLSRRREGRQSRARPSRLSASASTGNNILD